jgi:Transposase IS66 family
LTEAARERLKGFGRVLVSDFHPAYESLPCPQQKCLFHVMRDLNEAVLEYPYDEELKQIVAGFADLLKSIVQTIDHRGLKRRFLSKHVAGVSRFYREMSKITYNTEVSRKWRDRFEKNRDKLFTFLTYDGVPWNNNNAEHEIKAFARLRRPIVELSSPKGIEEYLILLSVCQTCRYSGVEFLDFLRSGQKDINAFAEFKGTMDAYTGIV